MEEGLLTNQPEFVPTKTMIGSLNLNKLTNLEYDESKLSSSRKESSKQPKLRVKLSKRTYHNPEESNL